MSNLIPFESANVPARFQKRKLDLSTLPAWATGGGFKSISIKGKVFHIVSGDERTLVTKPDSDDEPASSLEVIILRAAPGTAKVFYATGYTEGSDAKPSCYSNDGKAPAADAAEPQAKQCATCAHNQWGAKITESGKKAKACSDSVRLAVAPAGDTNDAMLLRVPATSIASLRELYKKLAGRGAALHDVVTKIGFDYGVAHPALTFKAVGFVPDEQIDDVLEATNTPTVLQITGEVVTEYVADEPAAVEEKPAPEMKLKPAAPKAEAKPKPAKSASLAAMEADDDAPKAKVAVEAKPAAPAKEVSSLEAELENALADMDFDD